MATTNAVGVDVNVATKSATYVTNTVMQVIQRIAHKRNLDPAYIQRNFQVIENGIRTWLTEHKLTSVMLQVYKPGSDQALENWKTVFEYRAEADSELRKPPVEQIEEFTAELRSLPPGVQYAIYADVQKDASHVDGWARGNPFPLFGKSRKDFIKWGFGEIDAGVEYEGGDWGSGRGDQPIESS